MADDNETLIFRIRAIAENLGAFDKTAKASDNVNLSMAKAQKIARDLTDVNKKLTLAHDRESDALGKVRVAEIKVNEIRSNSNAKTSQIAAAEERLLTARKKAAQAANDTQRIEQEFRNRTTMALEKDSDIAGQNSGRRFGDGFLKWLRGGSLEKGVSSAAKRSGSKFGDGFIGEFEHEATNIEKAATSLGRTFGSGFGSGIESVMKTQAGPIILGAVLAAVAIAAPAIGAVLAGGIVTAFGAGLVALPIVFAKKADAVKLKWVNTMAQMGADMQVLSRPFESVLIHIADYFQRTLNRFNPILRRVFAGLAGPVQKFADEAFRAVDGLAPAITPIADAFEAVLRSLGPALQDALHSVAEGLIGISDSVSKNPDALPEFVSGTADLTKELLDIVKALNDGDAAFRRLTGGISLVRVFMAGLKTILDSVAAPFVAIAGEIEIVSNTLNALRHSTSASGQSMSEAANKTALLLAGMKGVDGAARGVVPPLKSVHEIAVQNAQAAEAAKQKFEGWVTQLFALRDASVAMARAGLALKDAIAQATAGLRDNGNTLNTNTAAGRANYTNLLNISDASKTQTEQIIRNAKAHGNLTAGMVQAYRTSAVTREQFIKLATQMTGSRAAAIRLANQMVAIPNVSRTARLLADKKDLEAKIAAAKRQLDDPKGVTKARTAQLKADIRNAQHGIDAINTKLNNLPASKTVVVKYTLAGAGGFSQQELLNHGLATGGQVRGPGSGTSDTAGLYRLSNREWVIRAKSSEKYGDYAMASINDGTATVIPGRATGGPGGNIGLDMHSAGVWRSLAAQQKGLTQLFGGKAMAFARSQVGKPYIWGGVGPAGYDCSGFMSAIANVLQGRSPYQRRFATESLPAGMFVPGRGLFEIGWFKGNPGHTAGTLAGVNVESRGGRGVVVGSGARGAGDSLFTSGIYHLKGFARGGKVGGYGDPPFDGFKDWIHTLDSMESYAKGTSYVPHDGLAYLHKGERVTPASQNGPSEVTLVFKSDGSPYMEFLVSEFKKYVRVHGGDVQKVLGPRG